MKLVYPTTEKEQQEARNLLKEKIEDSLIDRLSVVIAKYKDDWIGIVAFEKNNESALLHAFLINKSYKNNEYSKKLMSALTMRMAYNGIRSLYVVTQNEDIFYYNLHFTPVEDQELPDAFRSYYQSKITDCKPRVFYKYLPNPWPYNPFR